MKLFDLFKSNKQPFSLSLEPSGQTFQAPKRTTLLQTALKNEVDFPYHCNVGTCGNCRCKLVKGDVKAILDFSYTLSDAEINEGYILACQSLPKSDVVIEIEIDEAHPSHPLESYNGVVKSTRLLNHDIMEVNIELERDINFSAGQYADISLKDVGRDRSYSFACAPQAGGQNTLSFHVRKVPNGKYTEWLFEKDRVGQTFQLHGPTGPFWLRKADKPILAIAGGSGLAPIKSILDDALSNGVNRPVTVLFAARQERDLYCLDEMKALQEKWPNSFKFIPILSREAADSAWTGNRGSITDFITDQTAGFSIADSHAYLCGSAGMIDALLISLEEHKLSLDNIHYDKFLDARQLDILG